MRPLVPPKSLSIAAFRLPAGSFAPPGAISSQKKEWFQWPPRLLRTPARTASGTLLRSDSVRLHRYRTEFGPTRDQLVGGIHIGCVVTIVVDHHGLRIDMRFKRIEGVAQRRQLERAGRLGRSRLRESGPAREA